MQGPYFEILSPKFRSTERACVKTEGSVFHGTARAIRLINSLLNGEKENILKLHREFGDNFATNLFHEICPK